ncbi:MAG: hypothetical protein AB1597_00340 [Chloroflexota bacterium]
MKKLGLQGRKWLKAIHITFTSTWIGAAIVFAIIPFVSGRAADGSELYTYYASIKLIDDLIIPPAGMGTLITGLLLCWQTDWGFLKYWSVIIPGLITVGIILLGIFALAPWVEELIVICKAEGIIALQNAEYLSTLQMLKIVGVIAPVIMIFGAFVSVIKPWGRVRKTERRHI